MGIGVSFAGTLEPPKIIYGKPVVLAGINKDLGVYSSEILNIGDLTRVGWGGRRPHKFTLFIPKGEVNVKFSGHEERSFLDFEASSLAHIVFDNPDENGGNPGTIEVYYRTQFFKPRELKRVVKDSDIGKHPIVSRDSLQDYLDLSYVDGVYTDIDSAYKAINRALRGNTQEDKLARVA